MRNPDPMESFINVHKNCKRSTPNQIMLYKHSTLLHKIFNSHTPPMGFIQLNFNQTNTSRETLFNSLKSTHSKIGNNLLSSRLTILNKRIKLIDLNMSISSFEVKYKQILMPPLWCTSCETYKCQSSVVLKKM